MIVHQSGIVVASNRIHFSEVLKIGAFTALASTGVNALIYVAAKSVDWIPESIIIPEAGQPITLLPVVMATVVAVLGATLGYYALAFVIRNTTWHRRLYTILAIALTAASFYTPLNIPNAPLRMIMSLELMHVVVAVAILTFFIILRTDDDESSNPTSLK